jgi:two-component system, chemotaxis family, CheB/CheR fusion protein
VVINAEGDVLQSSGHTGKYLELPPGAPDTNIFNLARPGLRVELRSAMHKTMGGGQLVVRRKIAIGTDGGSQEIDLYVQPLKFGSAPESLYLVVFQDLGPVVPPVDEEAMRTEDIGKESVRHLEAELRATRERLKTTTEELESSNEELKSNNEELQSINEELQSANEELETSKEELQSTNEELQTVNAELNARVEELSRANNDMNNLLESTQIATVFLDRSLLVKSFTPAAKDVFRLVESDAGRPISHVRPRFEAGGLQEDAERVLRTLTTIERPVSSTESGARYMMRLLPYRTTDNIITGVVITFADIHAHVCRRGAHQRADRRTSRPHR